MNKKDPYPITDVYHIEAIYDKLDKEIKFGNFYHYERTWNNQSISEILKERNKKNK